MLKISNVKVYGLEESIVASGYPMLSKPYTEIEFQDKLWDINTVLFDEERKKDLVEATKRIKTAKHLGSVPSGTGHDNFLRGIIVQYDVKYPVYWTPQFQRYSGYNNIVSSQSAMHRLTKMNLDESMNEYVIPEIKEEIKNMIDVYNKALSKGNKTVAKIIKYGSMRKIETIRFSSKTNGIMKLPEEIVIEIPIEDLYMHIISSCPQGLEKTMRVSTNYLQLKTMYLQRKNHKLKDWHEFCKWIEKLPYFKELTGVE